MRMVLDPFSFLVTSIAGWMNEHQHHVIHYLMEENRVLREQTGNRRLRFTDDQRRRLAAKAKRLGRKLLSEVATIVTRMAEENRSWGYRRIQGALSNLGHLLAFKTIGNILKKHGIGPAPERSRKTTWKEFLTRH